MKARVFLPFALIALLLAGCAHPAPQAIRLPTVAAVRAPLVAARASNARAAHLAATAAKHGIAAGSPEARELTLATADTENQLAGALAQVDQLTAQLLTAQTQVDAAERDRAAQTARADATEKKLAVTRDALLAAEKKVWHRDFDLFALGIAGVAVISLIGRQLETLLRDVELAAGHVIEGTLMKVPGVLKIVLRCGALLAFV